MRSKVCWFVFDGLDDDNSLVVITKIEPVFQKRRKNCPSARVAALGQTLDNGFLVGKVRFAQFADRRQKT